LASFKRSLASTEELRRQALAEESPPQAFGVEQLAVANGRHLAFRLGVTDGLDLTSRPVQVAGEGRELEQEQAARLVARLCLHLLNLGGDGVGELAGLVEIAGGHGFVST
jgi:hypothetical protein